MPVLANHLLKQLSIWALLTVALISHAQAIENIAIAPSDNNINVGYHIEWLEDPDGSISFADVRKREDRAFTPSNGYTFSKGYTSSSYWLRFNLDFTKGSLDTKWALEIPFPLLDYVSLYSPNGDGSYRITQTGDRLPFRQRDVDTTNFVFSLDPQKGGNLYYLHVRTQDSVQVPLTLWQQDAYPKHNALVTAWQGIYFGGMLVMILYNLFIYLSVRDRSYLFYICYITIFIAFQAGMQGYSFEYFWPENTWWANVNIPFFGVLALFFAMLFARSVLRTKTLIPRFDKVLLSVSSGLFLTLPVMLLGDYDIGILVSLVGTFIFFNLVLITAFLVASKGNRTAKIFALAWSIFLISGTICLLGITGILPLEFANVIALQIGSAIEVVLLSMVLADRINSMEREKTELEAESSRVLTEANKHLEDSNKLKDEFIATISHEVRTPMNGVLGSAQLLMDTTLTDNQHNYVNTINHSGQTLLEILNNILDYSKIEADKLEIEYIEFDLEELINECASFFAVQSEQSGVDFFVRIHKGTPSRVIGDPTRFKQILLNLISNAFKFTNNGQIIVHTKMQSGENSNLLRVEIEDSGIGLSEEQQEFLFQPFTQIDSTTARKFGGTGLGLAICKKLTHLMGGNIGVRSTQGQGSSFWFNTQVDIVEDGQDLKLPNSEKAYVLLNNKRQESLLKAQLQDWGLLLETEMPSNNKCLILTDKTHLSDFNQSMVLNNILVIGNCSTSHNKIRSPITASKLYTALTSLSQPREIQRPAKVKSSVSSDFSHLKVLAVDDNSVNRMIIKGLLKKFSISADIAESGEEAVNMASNQSNPYDLILMDIEMPGKDGYDTTRDIRAFEKTQGLEPKPIVALSAHAVKEYKGKALESGMNDFLSKPVDQDVLYEMLDEISIAKLATS